jgi:hypothetical protein
MKPPVALEAMMLVGRGRTVTDAEVAAELAGGALWASVAILLGLIKSGAADGPAMRAWLQSLVDELSPAERHLAYGFSLSQVIATLDNHLPAGASPSPQGRH